jgi:hypothetical protein
MVTRSLKVSVIIVAVLSLFCINCTSSSKKTLCIRQDKLASPSPTEPHSPPASKNQNLPHKKPSAAPLSKSSTITVSSFLVNSGYLVAIITFLLLINKLLIHVDILKHEISCHKNPPTQNPPCNQQKTENPENQYQQEQLIKENEKAIEELSEELRTFKTKFNVHKEKMENHVDNMTLGKYERDTQGQLRLFNFNYTKRFPQFYDENS